VNVAAEPGGDRGRIAGKEPEEIAGEGRRDPAYVANEPTGVDGASALETAALHKPVAVTRPGVRPCWVHFEPLHLGGGHHIPALPRAEKAARTDGASVREKRLQVDLFLAALVDAAVSTAMSSVFSSVRIGASFSHLSLRSQGSREVGGRGQAFQQRRVCLMVKFVHVGDLGRLFRDDPGRLLVGGLAILLGAAPPKEHHDHRQDTKPLSPWPTIRQRL
jgi:hypothetical protein